MVKSRLAPMSTSTPATTSPLRRLGQGAPGGRSRPKPVWSPRIVSPFLLTVDDTALAAVRCHYTRHATVAAGYSYEARDRRQPRPCQCPHASNRVLQEPVCVTKKLK